jgi:hypothetical protein
MSLWVHEGSPKRYYEISDSSSGIWRDKGVM